MISNASPLIIFASLNRLDLLKKVNGKVYISPEVYEEVVVAEKNEAFQIQLSSSRRYLKAPLK